MSGFWLVSWVTSSWRNSCEFIDPSDELPDAELLADVFEELVPLAVVPEVPEVPVVPEVPEVLGEETSAKALAKLGPAVPLVEVVGEVELLASIENDGICGRGWAIGEIELILLYPSVESVTVRRANGLLGRPEG